MGAKFEAIKHATSTGIMWHCENNLEQGSRIQVNYNDVPFNRNKQFGRPVNQWPYSPKYVDNPWEIWYDFGSEAAHVIHPDKQGAIGFPS